MLLTSLNLMTCSVFLVPFRNICLQVVSRPVNWTYVHQSLIKKMHKCYRSISFSFFVPCLYFYLYFFLFLVCLFLKTRFICEALSVLESLFPNEFSMCEVEGDIKLTHWHHLKASDWKKCTLILWNQEANRHCYPNIWQIRLQMKKIRRHKEGQFILIKWTLNSKNMY